VKALAEILYRKDPLKYTLQNFGIHYADGEQFMMEDVPARLNYGKQQEQLLASKPKVERIKLEKSKWKDHWHDYFSEPFLPYEANKDVGLERHPFVIDSNGLFYLLDFLQSQGKLQNGGPRFFHIDLSHNDIGPTGARSFVSKAVSITKLHMKDNRLGDEGAVSICGLLAKNELQSLDNSMTIAGVKAIFKALESNNSLEYLVIGGSLVPENELNDVVGYLRNVVKGDSSAAAGSAANMALDICEIRYSTEKGEIKSKRIDMNKLREHVEREESESGDSSEDLPAVPAAAAVEPKSKVDAFKYGDCELSNLPSVSIQGGSATSANSSMARSRS
jgi:hypothetical protein